MRYINTRGYQPRNWLKESNIYSLALKSCATSLLRKAYLDIPANKAWNKHKKAFERLSHGKCWFTEAFSSVSDYSIEHFRPKKKVDLIASKDAYPEKRTTPDLNGYWWLSYEIENLRLASYKPNQLKGNYFPLESTSIIATPLDNSWRREKNMLLDPCVKSDVDLLTYSGIEPIESDTNIISINHIRARISIKVYGFKFQRLVNARAREFQHVRNYYNEASRNWNAMNQNRGINQVAYDLAKSNFSNNCGYLVSMIRPDKQFTRMILSFLVAANKDWVNQYILRVATERKYI